MLEYQDLINVLAGIVTIVTPLFFAFRYITRKFRKKRDKLFIADEKNVHLDKPLNVEILNIDGCKLDCTFEKPLEDEEYKKGCVVEFAFSNPTNSDIYINQFSLIVKKLKINYQPVFVIKTETISEGKGIVIFIENAGWGESSSCKFKIELDESVFYKKEISCEIDKIDANEKKEIFRFYISDIRNDFKDRYTFKPKISFEAYSKENELLKGELKTRTFTDITQDRFTILGIGGGGCSEYAIFIPVDEETFKIDLPSNKIIKAHSIEKFMSKIFPLKSCEMTYSFCLTYNNGLKLENKPRTSKFSTPHYGSGIYDGSYLEKTIRQYVLNGEQPLEAHVFFPFANEKTLRSYIREFER